jgi:two-component system, response regulator
MQNSGLTEKLMKDSFILLVEDNADDAYLAMRVIGKVCSQKVIVARDGEEASNLLYKMAADRVQDQIRLILLDLKLPKMSGLEVLEGIRATPLLSALPVAVLTSSDNDLDQEKCRALGVLDYIYKPMTADRLQRVLSQGKSG